MRLLSVERLVAQKICMIEPLAETSAARCLLFPITVHLWRRVHGGLRLLRLKARHLAGDIRYGATLPDGRDRDRAARRAPRWLAPEGVQGGLQISAPHPDGVMVAFWAGDCADSYTTARMEALWTNGLHAVDAAVEFATVVEPGGGLTTGRYSDTFAGKYPWATLANMILTGYGLKVAYEVLATPVTYAVVGWLKASEHADAFDRHEDFNPFHLDGGSAENA